MSETFFFDTFRNAKSVNDVKAFEYDVAHDTSPSGNYEGSEQLSQEESPTTTVEKTVARAEESGENRSEETAHTVYRRGTHGIIDFQYMVDKVDGENHYNSTDGTDDDSSSGRNQVAAGRDTYQSGQNAVEGKGERRFSIFDPAGNQCHETASTGCKVGREEDVRDGFGVGIARSSQLRTRG